MFCWNWIYWSMNHSVQGLPNCSNPGWEGWRRSFPWRSPQMTVRALCLCMLGHACTHACHACPAQSQLRGFLLCNDGMLAGNVYRLTVVYSAFHPLLKFVSSSLLGYLAPWETGFSDWLPSGCCLVPQSCWVADFIHVLPAQTPLTAQWYMRDALGAVQWLQSCKLNPHECSEGLNSKPRVTEPPEPLSLCGTLTGDTGG